MKLSTRILQVLSIFSLSLILFSCSKSGDNTGNNTSSNPAASLFPLSLNNTWSYKLKDYDTSKGTVKDSSFFTLSIAGIVSANSSSYYHFQNSPDTMALSTLSVINSTTLGSIDSQFGTQYYTFFVSGNGDSTQSINSWPVKVSKNGITCQGTDKLFAHYADTTLENLDGIIYASTIKNVIETYDCSANKLIANIYFIKQGLGLVRYSKYIYNASGKPVLQTAWVLESEVLQ
jgi:hypothetical protein